MENFKIGIIGTASLGISIAGNLIKKGIPVTVYDSVKERIEPAKVLGAAVAGSLQELAAENGIIICTLDDITLTSEIFAGQAGIWDSLKENSTVIISGAIGPEQCTRIYARALMKQVNVIDAAISRSASAVLERELTLMIGGEENAVKACWPIFEAVAEHVFYVGSIGTGQAYKIINDLMSIGHEAVARECLDFGLKTGLNLEKMIEIIQVSTGDSWVLKNLGRNIKSQQPLVTAPNRETDSVKNTGVMDKTLAVEMADAFGVALPLLHCIDNIDEKSAYPVFSSAMKENNQ